MADVTIRDVAKYAGVGIGTVSRVLNDHPSVRDTTRHKVLTAITELDYAPNSSGRHASSSKAKSVAVIAPLFTRPSLVERLRGVEYALANTVYDLILFNVETPARRENCFRRVPRPERIDGMLIMSISPNESEADYFLQTGVPTILIDAHHPRLSLVVVDDVRGGLMAVQHLIDLGHRKIGYVSDWLEDPFDVSSDQDRYNGYRQALAKADIPFQPEYHQQGEHGPVARP